MLVYRIARAVMDAAGVGYVERVCENQPGDQAFDIGLRDQLQDGLSDGAKKIAAVMLGPKLGKVHSCLKSRNST